MESALFPPNPLERDGFEDGLGEKEVMVSKGLKGQ
jgi:hypothetical protein